MTTDSPWPTRPYETEAEAVDMVVRFAQDQGMLPYAVYDDTGSRLL